MKKHEMTDNPPPEEHTPETVSSESITSKEQDEAPAGTETSAEKGKEQGSAEQQIKELNDKHLRLYAEFDNYRKRVSREKEEMRKYGNESLLYELLPVLDNLELALKHGACDPKTGLIQGVEITLKEFRRVLEKFGLNRIETDGKSFDPSVHHAMSQVEREDIDEKMVAEEFRPGYVYNGKVLRPSLVAVSVKPKKAGGEPNDLGEAEKDE